jgi:hypothetical protein
MNEPAPTASKRTAKMRRRRPIQKPRLPWAIVMDAVGDDWKEEEEEEEETERERAAVANSN